MNERNTLVPQTDAQRDPNLCKPEDFEVLRFNDGDTIFHGTQGSRIPHDE
jgi:hypothetical protein